MSLEKFARERLMRDLPGFRKNGLNYWLKHINKDHCLEGMAESKNHGFVPDGTRFRKDVGAFDPNDPTQCFTLELWEIEDTWKLTAEKLDRIERLAHNLFDLAWIFTEVWVCNRYGSGREKVYDVRTQVLPPGAQATDPPYEWLQGGEWVTDATANNQLVNAP
jgi:hypothetical protein